jgi:hypothetical protein
VPALGEQHQSRWRTPVLVVAAAAYALGAATTRAFTLPADALTALPILTLAVLAVARWPLRPQPPELATVARGDHPYRAWGALFAAVVVFELAEYFFRGSRGAHPTLSSMADAVDRFYGLKALAFFGWLCLGALIVRRGARTRVRSVTPPEAS